MIKRILSVLKQTMTGKGGFLGAFLLFFALNLEGQEVEVSVQPNPVLVGETAMLTLTYSQNVSLESVAFPTVNGITWHQNTQSNNMQIINGNVKVSRSFGLSVNAPGNYNLPEIQLNASGNRTLKSRPFSFTAKKRDFGLKKADGSSADIRELIFIRTEFQTGRIHGYVGESIPVTLKYYYRSDLPVNVNEYPQFAENNVFAVTRITDPQTGQVRDFDLTGKTQEIIDHQAFNVLIFSGTIRPLQPGTLEGTINGTLNLKEQSRNNDPAAFFFADDFFGASYRPVPVNGTLPALKILPLPPPPREGVNLGIVGSYDLTASLSGGPYREGDPITVDVTLSGFSGDGIRAEKLNLSEFRAFAPEVSTVKIPGKGEGTRLRYILVPLNAGELPLKTAFAFFDPEKGLYSVTPLNQVLKVESNRGTAQPTSSALPVSDQYPGKKIESVSDILYLKPLSQHGLSLPLWSHGLHTALLMVLIALGLYAGCEIRRQILDSRNENPHYQRRAHAAKKRKSLLVKLQNASGNEFENLCRTELSDWISDSAGLPPGLTPGELAERMHRPELAEVLREVESVGYRPGGLGERLEHCRKTVCDAVRKGHFFVALLLMGLGLTVQAQITDSALALQSAYDRGDFQKALSGYESLLKEGNALQPALFYNLGNCLYQLRDYSRALVMYERARRLSPGDSDIRNNLNAVCRKLEINERGKVVTPLDMAAVLRDTFRPDSWLLFAAFGLTLALLSLCALRLELRFKSWAGMGTGLLLVLISLLFFFWQEAALYSSDEAVVMKDRVPVWNLPLAQSAKQLAALNAGLTVQIKERRTGWTLIRYEGGEGWISDNAVVTIWPPNLPEIQSKK